MALHSSSSSSSSLMQQQQEEQQRRRASEGRCTASHAATTQLTEDSCCAVRAAAAPMMPQNGRLMVGVGALSAARDYCESVSRANPKIASMMPVLGLCLDDSAARLRFPSASSTPSAGSRVTCGGGEGTRPQPARRGMGRPAAGATHVSPRPLEGCGTPLAPPSAGSPSLPGVEGSKSNSSKVFSSRSHQPCSSFHASSRTRLAGTALPRPRGTSISYECRAGGPTWTAMAAALLLLQLLGRVAPVLSQVPGDAMRCHQEGQAIPVPPEVERDNPCISCSCQNKIVVCSKQQCPSLEGCYWKMMQREKQCCQQCKGCIHEGQWHPHGARWAQDSTHYHCLSGVLTVTQTECHLPCDAPLPPKDGAFCQSCPGCWLEGRRVSEGEMVASRADPCVTCSCSSGHLTCQKRACPVLSCPPARRVLSSGGCCMTCQGSRQLITPPGERCFLNGFLYTTGQQRTLDHCTTCTCHKSYITCRRTTCPVLNCPREDQETPDHECCPVCVKKPYGGKMENCTIHGMTRRNGEQWQLDQCTTCTCANGSVVCEFMDCPYINKPCPPGYKRVESEHECCPRCEEAPGVCVVFGDPHYWTFDGLFFNFQGACKYTLAEKCRDPNAPGNFSLKVSNDARRSNNFSWTKSLTLRLPGTKVKLCQKLRVKVNGTIVKPPYQAPGVLTLTKEGQAVTLTTPDGLRVLWDGQSYVEVEVPRSLRGLTCGLCGNFNGDVTDDLSTKRGTRVSTAPQMAMSWAVGRARRCSSKMNRLNASHNTLRRQQRLTCPETHSPGHQQCGLLNSTVFQPCHSVVPFEKFLESCMLDMCECKTSRRCECDTLQAYARQCQRLGINVQDWRRVSGCGGLQCPHGAKYMECAPSCRATCRNPTPNPKCHTKRCRPGCYCPPPTVLHRGACIPAKECRKGKRRRRNRRRNR